MRLVDEGRGQGHWDDYRAWLWVHRKNASPLSNQSVVCLPGYDRGAHFYSRTEKVIAYVCKWNGGDAVDVREQFPLWPMPHVHPLVEGVPCWNDPTVRGLWEIAEEANIPHGTEPGSDGVPYVASMDLMLTLLLGPKRRLRGLSIKPHDEVTRAEPTDRILERHELERRYMSEVEGSLKIIDASLFNLALRMNVDFLSGCADSSPPLTDQVTDFYEALRRCKNVPLPVALELAATCAQVSTLR